MVGDENPQALILSGGPRSVYEKGAPCASADVFRLGIPVLGICYGVQLMAHLLGGKVVPSSRREYGLARLDVRDRSGLLKGIKDKGQVWMSHGDRVEKVPPRFTITGRTANTKVAVVESPAQKFFGVQFHPESYATENGIQILKNFLQLISSHSASP